MKAISFLGPTKYEDTRYEYRDKSFTTRFFVESLPVFYPDLTEILVFVTPKVAQHPNLSELQQRLPNLIRPVEIPDGRSEEDLWMIFDALTESIDEGERVLFDITNSYRSLPFLIFLTAAYLRSVREVDVEAVLYGAFEAKFEGITPVFDLTPFVSLLDWLTASDQFIQTGDARRLAHLMRTSSQGERSGEVAADALTEVSLATFLCNPFDLMTAAGGLGQRLAEAEAHVHGVPRPFGLVRDRIAATFSPFSAEYEHAPAEGLRAEYRLISWYHANNHLIQAMTLAREWLISAVAYRLTGEINLHSRVRPTFERALSGLAMVGRDYFDHELNESRQFTPSDLNEYGRTIYDEWQERDELKRLWNQLTPVRNELNHAFHKQGSMKVSTLVKKTSKDVMPMLGALAARWGYE